MSKATVFFTLVVASGAAALLATDQIAFAQSGSIGGTIGKTDKSVSGGDDYSSEPRRPSSSKRMPSATDTSRSGRHIFDNPTIEGKKVDHCFLPGTECDEPAASTWCRQHGFSHATSSKWEYTPQTYVQGNGAIGVVSVFGSCGGFVQIVCER
jgi:hypothetical protein